MLISPSLPPRAAIRILGCEFGRFPQVDHLNPRFLAGRDRLRLTLEIHARGPIPPRRTLIARLQGHFPRLDAHRCAGGARLDAPRGSDGLEEDEVGAGDARIEVAHLVEHLIIDIQHFIADMRICSGVTCGYQHPPDRFDLYIESPGRDISRLGIALAIRWVSTVLSDASPDPIDLSAVRLARAVRQHRLEPITSAAAREWIRGETDAARTLGVLHALGFLLRFEACVDFSGMPLYRTIEDAAAAP